MLPADRKSKRVVIRVEGVGYFSCIGDASSTLAPGGNVHRVSVNGVHTIRRHRNRITARFVLHIASKG